MSKRFSLQSVTEAAPGDAVRRLGVALADSPGWVGAFIVVLDGMGFDKPPSMTPGALFFEAASRQDDRGRRILMALDDAYADVRDGDAASAVHGAILEQFVYHALERRFPHRIGACEVLCEGAPISVYRLDAATSEETPAAAVEAKTSTRALKRRGQEERAKARAKASWVTLLDAQTSSEVSGVWATWVPESRFRKVLHQLIGDDAANAVIIGHERLRQLPARLANVVRQQTLAIERREREETEGS